MPSTDLTPQTAGPLPVTRATPADLAYIVHVQKRNGYALGFLPRAALQQKIDLGRIWLATENGDPAGYLHHGSLAVPEVRIFQAAVQYDARRRHLGLALVGDLVARAAAAGAQGVSLRCLSDLDANTFWRAAGFALLATEPGAKGALNVWGRRIGVGEVVECSSGGVVEGAGGEVPGAPSASPAAFTFHSRLHPCPACGRVTTDTWTRGAVRRRLCRACAAGGA